MFENKDLTKNVLTNHSGSDVFQVTTPEEREKIVDLIDAVYRTSSFKFGRESLLPNQAKVLLHKDKQGEVLTSVALIPHSVEFPSPMATLFPDIFEKMSLQYGRVVEASRFVSSANVAGDLKHVPLKQIKSIIRLMARVVRESQKDGYGVLVVGVDKHHANFYQHRCGFSVLDQVYYDRVGKECILAVLPLADSEIRKRSVNSALLRLLVA